MAKAKPTYSPPALPWVQKVAAFYSGNNPYLRLGVDDRGPMGATAGIAGSGDIRLGSGIWDSLANFDKYVKKAKKGDKNAAQMAAVLGANGLAVLLHEATHSRTQPVQGLQGWENERQAAALGAELVPDLLQRFFGIPIGSPLSKKIAHSAKTRSEYATVYPDDKYDV